MSGESGSGMGRRDPRSGGDKRSSGGGPRRGDGERGGGRQGYGGGGPRRGDGERSGGRQGYGGGGPRRGDGERGGGRQGSGGGGRRAERRSPGEIDARRAAREAEPPLDSYIKPAMLDRATWRALGSLNLENAEVVARHLVAADIALDDDPELAYRHALAAQRRAGRVDVVREAVATTAYLTGRYAEAVREARTVRRLSGDNSLRAIEADSERGLGRPERALAVIGEVNLAEQPVGLRTELAIVASGARADLGEFEAGLLAVTQVLKTVREPDLRARLLSVQADRLDDLGRGAEAAAVREEIRVATEAAPEEEPVLYLDDTLDPELALAVQLEEAAAAAGEGAGAEEEAAADAGEDAGADAAAEPAQPPAQPPAPEQDPT